MIITTMIHQLPKKITTFGKKTECYDLENNFMLYDFVENSKDAPVERLLYWHVPISKTYHN